MRHSLAGLLLTIAMVGCGSDPLTPRGGSASDAGGGGRADAGAAGVAEGGAGDAGDGAGGVSGADGDAGAAGAGAAGDAGAGTSEGGQAGAPPVPVIGYRLAGIAYGTFASGEGGAAGASGGEAGEGGAASEGAAGKGAAGEAGAAGEGAAGELPHIDRAECNFYLDFVDVVEDEAGGFEAFAIGEIFRNVYAGEQRWEFSAFIGGPASFVVNDDGSADLRAFGDQTGAKQFWQEIEVLQGTRNANGTSGGVWSCASLELFDPGFPDTSGIATGTWLLVPVN